MSDIKLKKNESENKIKKCIEDFYECGPKFFREVANL
jgi:hypothetical protein